VKIALGADHAGFRLKEHLRQSLVQHGYEVEDFGTDTEESTDYPDYAAAVARSVAEGHAERGVLLCGTGVGMAIAANKIDGVRAVNCSDTEFCQLARRHNDANVLALPARFIAPEFADELVQVFLHTPFEGGRHQRRLDKIRELE
jgi:ribose 5-phosphate isomerase B